MDRCTKCILPTTYSAVTFDSSGVCNLCTQHEVEFKEYERGVPERLSELEDLIALIREEGKAHTYDCIVPLSGGLDSTYVAYQMSRKYGLRVLGFNYDNAYRTPLAVENLERTSLHLNMPLVSIKPSEALMHKMYAHFFRETGYFCTVCNAVGYLVMGSLNLRETRLRGRKPLMVGGWAKRYEYQPGISVLSMKAFGEVLRRDPSLYDELRFSPMISAEIMDAYVKVEDIRQLTSPDAPDDSPFMRLIQLPQYIRWQYSEIKAHIEEHLDWTKRENGHEAHFDCHLSSIQEYLKHRRHGFSQETIKNSALIREGQMSREDALERISLEQTEWPSQLDELLSSWNLTKENVGWDKQWAE